MMSSKLANFALLPELKLDDMKVINRSGLLFMAHKVSKMEVCPKCATPSTTIYDHRKIKVKDEPLRGKFVIIEITKRRFLCKKCRKPFTEPVPGITKGKRTTARFQRGLTWACQKFSSLKDVQKAFRCSSWMVYRSFYEQLELNQRKRQRPVPKKLGIDEHSLRKIKYKPVDYATIMVDHTNKKVFELFEGRSAQELEQATAHLTGFEEVEFATLDLSPTYRSFLRKKCPKAKLVADRFHVQRLFTKMVNSFRLKVTGDKRKPGINRILLRNGRDLDWELKKEIQKWLLQYPDLNEVYQYKEAMHRFYRIKGYKKAKKALMTLLDRMGKSSLDRVKELRKVILNWRGEILNYFIGGHSNGRTEGFNRKAKLLQRKCYGIKSFRNYRLRLLNECQ